MSSGVPSLRRWLMAFGERDVQHLRGVADRLADDLLDAAVVTMGTEATRREDGIAVIPAAVLAP